jgi:endonuclease/exonuclease/phosphatase (EEP) superfamily protein YafD
LASVVCSWPAARSNITRSVRLISMNVQASWQSPLQFTLGTLRHNARIRFSLMSVSC